MTQPNSNQTVEHGESGRAPNWFTRAWQNLQQVHITLKEFATFTAGLATVVGSTVVFHPPFTPWVKWITAAYAGLGLLLFLTALLNHFHWQESKYQKLRILRSVFPGIVKVRAIEAFLLMVASAVLLAGSLSWPAPDERQIAQQMLNDRGMFLTRLYFKTALEVGNSSGVKLFLEAGFPPTLAMNLFGEQAETVPDRQVIDTFFALEHDPKRTILEYLAKSVDEDKKSTRGSTRSVFNVPIGKISGSERGELQEPGNRYQQMDLLGQALLIGDRTTLEMLRLGADPYTSLGVLFHPQSEIPMLVVDETKFKPRGHASWDFAADIYRYVSSATEDTSVSQAAMSTMLETGVAPGYCDNAGLCELGSIGTKKMEEVGNVGCDAERLVHKGRLLIFYYPDTTLRDGQVWAFLPHAKGELCSGRTVSYYGVLSNVSTGVKAYGTVRILNQGKGSTIYVVGQGNGGKARNVPLLPVLAWRGESAKSWHIGNLGQGRGIVVDTQNSWGKEHGVGESLIDTEQETECSDKKLSFLGSEAKKFLCKHSFSLGSVSGESDAVFIVTQTESVNAQSVYWHAVDKMEVHFAKGTYVIEARQPRLTDEESHLEVKVQEIALGEGEFEGDYAELPAKVDIEGVIGDENDSRSAGLLVLEPKHVVISLTELQTDVDVRLTNPLGQEIASSIEPSNDDEQVDVLLWPGRYILNLEAVEEESSRFRLKLNSHALASNTLPITKTGSIRSSGKSFEVLAVSAISEVTVGVASESGEFDIVLEDANRNEVEVVERHQPKGKEIVARVWPGPYAINIIGPADSLYELDVGVRSPEFQGLPLAEGGRLQKEGVRFVGFEINETTTVRASLSKLSADVDLKVVGSEGEIASSVNAGDTSEWLEMELAPGQYFLVAYALHDGSEFLLAASNDPEWMGPEANNEEASPSD